MNRGEAKPPERSGTGKLARGDRVGMCADFMTWRILNRDQAMALVPNILIYIIIIGITSTHGTWYAVNTSIHIHGVSFHGTAVFLYSIM